MSENETLPAELRAILDEVKRLGPAGVAAAAGLDFVFYNWADLAQDGVRTKTSWTSTTAWAA